MRLASSHANRSAALCCRQRRHTRRRRIACNQTARVASISASFVVPELKSTCSITFIKWWPACAWSKATLSVRSPVLLFALLWLCFDSYHYSIRFCQGCFLYIFFLFLSAFDFFFFRFLILFCISRQMPQTSNFIHHIITCFCWMTVFNSFHCLKMFFPSV